MRFYGKVGFETTVEGPDSVWTPVITEKPYYGDVLRNNTRKDSTDRINDTMEVNNRISIVIKPDDLPNFQNIRYVEWKFGRWNVKSIDIQMPRVILEIGGVYNGETPS